LVVRRRTALFETMSWPFAPAIRMQ
jgi:hypothetical protein